MASPLFKRLPHPDLHRAPSVLGRAPSLPAALPSGRLIELISERGPSSGSSVAAFALREAQREGSLVAWIEHEEGALFPPDLAAAGLDLGSLLIVRTPSAGGVIAIAKAAEILLRTGAFGALTLDLSALNRPRGEAFLARLAALAREHSARVLILRSSRPKSSLGASLGASIALRLDAQRVRIAPARFRLELSALKNKIGQPPPRIFRTFGAPEGIR